jgi:hypothetical protein
MVADRALKIHSEVNGLSIVIKRINKEYNFHTTCSLLPCNDKAMLFREEQYSSKMSSIQQFWLSSRGEIFLGIFVLYSSIALLLG